MTARRKRSAGPRFLRSLGDHLLTLLAIGGAVCIVLVLLSWIFSISIMMFRTGSMSPTITAGSIAVVREIPATEMAEGDVVTVDRGEGVLPVTHRVVEILEADRASGEVTFTMRGDANDVADPEPYTVSEVQRVMFSVPGAARIIQWFSDPFVLGGITLGATILVIWAFWPRARQPDGTDGAGGAGGVDAVDGSDGPDDPGGSQEAGAPDRDPDAARFALPQGSRTLHALAVPVAVSLVLAFPTPGSAETSLITGEHLRIRTEGDTARMQNLAPGESTAWEVGVWAEAPDPGQIDLAISGRGELAEAEGALLVSVAGCAEPWAGETCPVAAMTMLETRSLASITRQAQSLHLATMPSDEQRWLRITVTLSSHADALDLGGAHGDVLIQVIGAGEEISTGPSPERPGDGSPGADGSGGAPGADGSGGGSTGADGSGGGGDGSLARTGVTGVLPLALIAAALAAAGAGLRRSRTRRESTR